MLLELSRLGGTIDAIFFCPHAPREGCRCRKPKPGLLLEIEQRLRLSLDSAYFIGDSQRDVDAARAAGAKPMLVRTGKGAETEQSCVPPVPTFDDLGAAVEWILATETAV